MLKITKLFILALKVFGADNNKVVSSSGRANKTVENLSQSKKPKNIKKLSKLKVKYLKYPIFLNSKANKIFYIKNILNKYFLATIEALFKKLIV